MRTVSFSSAPVHDRLSDGFVCCSINTDGDPSAGASVGHAPADTPGQCTQGVGKQNVQCLFLTQDGEIFHTASGFQGPEDLQRHLEAASTLFAAIRNAPDHARRIVREFHEERLTELDRDNSSRRTAPAAIAQFMTQFTHMATRGRRRNRTSVDDMFEFKTQNAEYSDNRYMVEHPLITLEEFQRNPRELVGREHTAFISVGNGGASGGQIGR